MLVVNSTLSKEKEMQTWGTLALGGFVCFSIGILLNIFLKNAGLVRLLLLVTWFDGIATFSIMSYLSFKARVISAGYAFFIITTILALVLFAFIISSISSTIKENRVTKSRKWTEEKRTKAWNYYEDLDSKTRAQLLESARTWFGYEYPHLLNERLLVIEYLLSGKHEEFKV